MASGVTKVIKKCEEAEETQNLGKQLKKSLFIMNIYRQSLHTSVTDII